VLLVELPATGPLVLGGDLYYAPVDRAQRRVPGWNVDRDETLRSMDRIEQLITARGATLIIHHDPTATAALPNGPLRVSQRHAE